MTKHKFNAGDKAILIFWEEEDKEWRVSNVTIESVALYKDRIEYYLEGSFCDEISEKYLYTKAEAIKFLEENLND